MAETAETLRLPRKPEARTEKVEDLVDKVVRGRIRVPGFQRGLKWEAKHVVELFDSIYRGYPIGSLLFYKAQGPAGTGRLGPLKLSVPETPEAWWVIDGQQRSTALAAALSHPLPLPNRPSLEDPYVVYFNPVDERFVAPPTSGVVPSTWVPLPHLLEGAKLTEWMFGWEHGRDDILRHKVFDVGQRIREYPVPLYLIETEDIEQTERIAEEIFYRTNQSGVSLKWEEVHKALFGRTGSSPSTLQDLSEELAELGMGRFPEKALLNFLVAMRGEDPTQNLAEHRRRDRAVLADAVPEALPVLRSVLSFLRHDAYVPHLRLLPKSVFVEVLTRFFALHPAPKPRTRQLLKRWFWRTTLGGGLYSDLTLRSRGVDAVDEDEEGSAQALLALTKRPGSYTFRPPQTFQAHSVQSRITLVALAHLGPRDLRTGELIDVAAELEASGAGFFPKLFEESSVPGFNGVENRLLHPPRKDFEQELFARALEDDGDLVLSTHLLWTEDLINHWAAPPALLQRRRRAITDATQAFTDSMAAWEHSDRPSFDYLLADVEDDNADLEEAAGS